VEAVLTLRVEGAEPTGGPPPMGNEHDCRHAKRRTIEEKQEGTVPEGNHITHRSKGRRMEGARRARRLSMRTRPA
jgi:hypothetical protein